MLTAANKREMTDLNSSSYPQTLQQTTMVYQPAADDIFGERLTPNAEDHEVYKFFDALQTFKETRPRVEIMSAKNIDVELLKAWASHNYVQDYRSLLTMEFKDLKDLSNLRPSTEFASQR